MDQLHAQRGPCDECGKTAWTEASDEQYAATTDRMRSWMRDARQEADFRPPDRVLICQGCGATVIVLTQTFHTPDGS
jgi:hypothetical protein